MRVSETGSVLRPHLAVAALCLAAFAGGCDESSPGAGQGDELPPGSVIFHFRMHGDATGEQDFRAATNDQSVIDAARDQLLLPENERTVFISGPIRRGDGNHNLEWNWHFAPGQWELAEAAIELCDGNAVLVSQDIDYWVDTVGQFCPWGSYVAEEVPEDS
jgi:hypothetical protein